MAGVEYYADTVWHCKSTASSLLPLSNVFKMYFSHVPSALSSLNIEIMNAVERQCHYYFRSPKSLFLFFLCPFSRRLLLHLVSSPRSLCISGSVPSKQSHTTHSDLICLSFLPFHKLHRWDPGVAVGPCDGALEILGGVTAKPRACLQNGCMHHAICLGVIHLHCYHTVYDIDE